MADKLVTLRQKEIKKSNDKVLKLSRKESGKLWQFWLTQSWKVIK